jgi:hypothetical protein
MADELKVKITGLAELEKKLLSMGQEFGAKALASSAYSANKTFQDAIKNQIQAQGLVDTGLLHKSITRKRIIYAKNGKLVVITGVSKNTRGLDKNGKRRIPWKYANILEGKYNFTQNAFNAVKDKVVEDFVKVLERKIKKYEKNNPNPPVG